MGRWAGVSEAPRFVRGQVGGLLGHRLDRVTDGVEQGGVAARWCSAIPAPVPGTKNGTADGREGRLEFVYSRSLLTC